jgi:tetratricopeptide (TPR) repeat protein
MPNVPAKFKAKYHEPGRNDPCVCGSGIKFKKCCSGTYSSDAAKLFRTAYNQGNYELALIEQRRHFTWYVLSHKAHTIPFLESNSEAAKNLLRIDIEALGELLDNLHRCYFFLGRSEEFPAVINSARNLIADPRWADKIAYAKGLWHLLDHGDESAAYNELAPIDMASCKDADILSLYLQVSLNDHTLPDALSIIDRIIENTVSESVKLQYRVLKAVKYYLVCQDDEANRIFEDAFARFEALSIEKQSTYGRVHFAQALEIYGKAGFGTEALEKSKAHSVALIAEAQKNNYNAMHIGNLQRLLGDCQEALGDHEAAKDSYTESFQTYPNEVTKLFLARAACNAGQLDSARGHLKDADEEALDEAGRFDLAISWALLAAKSLRITDIETAKAKMRAVSAKDPVFIQLRDRWTIDLLEIKPTAEPGKIRRLIRRLNGWVTLNPSLFGIGLNINKIIDEIDRATDQDET